MISIILKIIAVLILVPVLFIVSGISGLTFYVWPTNFNDHSLNITERTLSELNALKSERKFMEDRKTFYPGAVNEKSRVAAQIVVDELIEKLIKDIPHNSKRSVVLKHFKNSLNEFDTSESEERDQFLIYLQKIMAIVGIDSSGELLTVWRYGFPYGWLLRA